MTEYKYTIGAVGGSQNGRSFYQATVPLRLLASLLKLDDDFDVTKRSQRMVDTNRAKKFTKYLVDNVGGFSVIPPLVGFIEGDFKFVPVPLDGYPYVGTLEVSMDAKFLLFDGQHRSYGIREAMQEAVDLQQDTVSIMFFSSLTLAERQQAFHDINFTQKTPAASICIAYNERNYLDRTVIDVLSTSHIRGFIDYEKNTVSGKSPNVFSLKNLKDFAHLFFARNDDNINEAHLKEYVDELFEVINIPAMLTVIGAQLDQEKSKVSPAQVYREESIVPHAVTIKALGMLGRHLMASYPQDWKQYLNALKDKSLLYRDDSGMWLNRCVNYKGKMISNQLAVRLTYYGLKRLCSAPLTPEERAEEAAEVGHIE